MSKELEKLEFVHFVLQESLTHIDIKLINQALVYVEDSRKKYYQND